MSRLLLSAALSASLLFASIAALAQTDDGSSGTASPGAGDFFQQGMGLLGGLPFGNMFNTSGVSAPSINVGSGSSSTGASIPGAITSLFNSLPGTFDLTPAGTGASSTQNLFSSLFGALPSVSPGASDALSGLGSTSQTLSLQALNMAQSFSSSLQNIFAPQTSTDGSGASNQTNTQNNLTSLMPVSALQGSASSANTTSNNGVVLSIGAVNFNFGQ
ncbi:MAG: hypothetical protein ACOZEN_14220 [Thermodesulfobacteriota bacterium]